MTYKVYFNIGDRKLKITVEAKDEIDAWDKVKDKMQLIAIEKQVDDVPEIVEKMHGVMTQLINLTPDMDEDQKTKVIEAMKALIRTETDVKDVIDSIKNPHL